MKNQHFCWFYIPNRIPSTLGRGKLWQLLAVLLAAATWLIKSWTFRRCFVQKPPEIWGICREEGCSLVFTWVLNHIFSDLFPTKSLRLPHWVLAVLGSSFPFGLWRGLWAGPRPRRPRRTRSRRRGWNRKEAMACGAYNPTGRTEVQEVQSLHPMSPRCLWNLGKNLKNMGCWMDLVTECDTFWRFLESKLHEIWCNFGLEAREYAGHILTNSNGLLTDVDVAMTRPWFL